MNQPEHQPPPSASPFPSLPTKDSNSAQDRTPFATRIDITILYVSKSGKEHKEVLLQYDVKEFLNKDGDIYLAVLLNDLKRNGFPLNQSKIYYYSNDGDTYIYCGIDPLLANIMISNAEFKTK